MPRIPLLLAALLLTVVSSPLPAGARPKASTRLTVAFEKSLYGDFVLAGNTVTECPPDQQQKPPRYPAARCREGQNKSGTGAAAQNNGHSMIWADVDKDKATFNSSTAKVTVPAGARIAFAQLNWAGVGRIAPEAPCGKDAPVPAGAPATQAVSLAVAGKAAVQIGPKRFKFTMDEASDLYSTDQAYYSANADVTAELAGQQGDIPVTVGNVWTPQGYDCFGGWSIVVVWAFDNATAGKAEARRTVTVYNGHLRVFGDGAPVTVHTPPLRAAGGTARLGFTAYEGDWASAGDGLKINSRPLGDSVNFFAANAAGQVSPNTPNNMSVDARTIEVSDQVVKPGDPTAKLGFSGDADAYLVQNLVLSFPMPELTVSTATDKAVVHEGDPVTQTIRVGNPGSAPASDVMVYAGVRGRCRHQLGVLDAGKTVSVSCVAPAVDDDYSLTARVLGRALTGDRMDLKAVTQVEVLRPVLVATMAADPAIVLAGQPVNFEIKLRNAGDTPLAGVTLKNTKVSGCDQGAPPTLAPAASAVVRCTITAGDESLANTVTASGKDPLGKDITVSADASYEVVRPRLGLKVDWPSPLVRGQLAHVPITVTNESKIPLTDVRVTGMPSSCERTIGVLQPGEAHRYECVVVVDAELRSELTVHGTPMLNGQPVTGMEATVSSTRITELSTQAPVVIMKPAAQVPEERLRPAPESNKPPTAVGIVSLAVLGMVLVFGTMAAGRKAG